MHRPVPRPSPALVLSLIALVAALAGSAVALPGKGKVDRNDLKRGAVTPKALKKGAVTPRALRGSAVTTPAIATAAITPEKIAPLEAPHVVGAANEPAFGNGGEGDCNWRNATGFGDFEPVSFYVDAMGIVHLNGAASSDNGAGGDQVCDPGTPGEEEDGVVFSLPSGYEPARGNIFGPPESPIVVAPAGGAVLGGVQLGGGAVISGIGSAALDGLTFRAAPRPTPDVVARVGPRALERFAR